MVGELGVIVGGLVGVMKAWLGYDMEKRKALQEGKEAPTPPATAAQGEQAIEVVRQGIAQYGTENDQKALNNFEDEPEDYATVLEKKLIALAERQPAFAEQLQQQGKQVQQAGIQMHGEVKAYDHAIMKQAVGVNVGTMTYKEDK